MKYTLKTSYIIPSANTILGHHWSKKGREMKRARDEIYYSMLENRLATLRHEERKAKVKITRVYSGRSREMDVENIFTKGCFDALVHLGLLKDDSPKWVTTKVEQRRGDGNYTTIEIEYVK